MKTSVTTNATTLPPTTPAILSQQSDLWIIHKYPILSPRNPILSTPHILRPITFTQCRRREEEEEESGFRFDDGLGDAFYRKRRRDGRRWWSDDSPEEVEDAGIIEEVIDSIWILKVFGSYGWLLPFFIISLLAATGPKAFLLSLAVPVGQSVLTLAFNKLFNKPKRKTKTRKKRRARTASKSVPQEEAAEEQEPPTMREMGYKTWVPSDDSSGNEDIQDSSSFGGWEELVESREENDAKSSRRSESDQTGQPKRSGAKAAKFSRRERKAEMPLLLRLLVAVFPFLGSWTKML